MKRCKSVMKPNGARSATPWQEAPLARGVVALGAAALFTVACSDESPVVGGGEGASATAGGSGGSVHAGGDGGSGAVHAGGGGVGGSGGAESAGYPFQGYTTTRGAFQAIEDLAIEPRILVVDSLSNDPEDGDLASGRGSLPWALEQEIPRVILFEISGVIEIGGQLGARSPYVSIYGQTAPAPGITLYDGELFVGTHDVIVQHLRVRMGETLRGGGDSITICGAEGDTVHDIIIDHCSPALGHDEQLSISDCGNGIVSRVTLSNNLISFGADLEHNYGTLIESGDNNDHGVDEVLVEGNLYSQLSYRTPMVNDAARRVTIANNVTYNAFWVGMHFSSGQYPEGQYIDVLNTLYWRGSETADAGQWPTDEVDTWPAEPELWPSEWNEGRRHVSDFAGPSGENTHVYYEGNYDYVNNEDYQAGDHEGRPVEIAWQRFYDGQITAEDVTATSRQTSVAVRLMTPAELEAHVEQSVGARPFDRDALDALAVSQAFDRTGGYIASLSELGVPVVPEGSATRGLDEIGGYPTGTELDDSDGDGLTDLEEWIYGL